MRPLLKPFVAGHHADPFLFRCGLALYLAVIVLGSIPGAREEVGHVASGLVLHFVTYACIAFLLACGTSGNATVKAAKAVFLVAAMGALDELIQSTLPYRHGAVADWAVDAGAALCAALCFRIAAGGKAAPAS